MDDVAGSDPGADPSGWADDITAGAPAHPGRRLIVAAPIGRVGPPASPSPSAPARRGSRRNLIVTAVALSAVGAAVVFLTMRATPVALEVDGKPIRNAATVIAQAEAVFRAVVEADGARPSEGARYYFAPAAEEGRPPGSSPRAACGPVLLGISGTDRPWVVGSVSYSATGAEEVIGRFDRFTAAEDLDERELRRPDGRRPAGTSGLEVSTEGIRDEEGRRLVGVDRFLAAADRGFAAAARTAGASVETGSRCYLGHVTTAEGQRISDRTLWCGPVLLLDSGPDEAWATYDIRVTAGDVFGTAQLDEAGITTVTGTKALGAGVSLFRPDGEKAPGSITLAPPDAAPQAPGFVEVLGEEPDGVTFTRPADGRIVTPGRFTTIDGLARVPRMGAGRDAVVAAAGEDLVVARFQSRRPEGAPTRPETAVVVSGTARTPVPRWGSVDRGTLVVSVPGQEHSVALEVLFDGRAQTISLLTGTRGADSPAALYRSANRVGIGRPAEVEATLPEAQVVRSGGTVTEAVLAAWRSDRGWAPAGRAFLEVEVDGWSVDRPCCKVTKVEATPVWRLVLPDSSVVDPLPPAAGSPGAPLFLVPEGLTDGRVELALRVRYEHGGAPGEVVAGPAVFELRLPA